MSDPVVLDPGHGGDAPAGGSTPLGARSADGLCERDVTLRVALLVGDALAAFGVPALFTRESDADNPTPGERTFAARDAEAAAFVSIHCNAGPPGARGSEVWVHTRAGDASQRLGESLQAALSAAVPANSPDLCAGELAVLDPGFHAPGCAACLVELAYLTDPDDAALLADGAALEAIARALARGIVAGLPPASDEHGSLALRAVDERFDVWHEVPLVQQLTGMSCWAAAAAMLVGWRDCVDIDPEEVAAGAGRWEAYRDGLVPEDVDALARAWSLQIEPPRRYSVQALRELLERAGPLWVGEASPGLHVIVITGMHGDGTPDGTLVRIADPWPVGEGERYSIPFSELARRLDAAAGLSGVPAQVLHSGGRGGTRSVFSQRREVRLSMS